MLINNISVDSSGQDQAVGGGPTDAHCILKAFLPPGDTSQQDTSSSLSQLSFRDVPRLIQDFVSVLLRLERKCIIGSTGDIDLKAYPPVQVDARICASLNARIHDFFASKTLEQAQQQTPTDSNVASEIAPVSPDDAFMLAKLKNDYEKVKPKFIQLCNSYSFVPDIPLTLSSLPSFPSSSRANPYGTSPSTATPYSDTAWPSQLNVVRTNGSLSGAESYTATTSSSSSYMGPPAVQQLDTMAVELQLREEQLQEIRSLMSCVESLRTIEENINQEVFDAQDGLDATESALQGAENEGWEATKELAKASKEKYKWWSIGSSSAGLVAGGVAGLTLGPVGLVAGAAAGGVLGLVTGSALTHRHRKHMDKLCTRQRTRQGSIRSFPKLPTEETHKPKRASSNVAPVLVPSHQSVRGLQLGMQHQRLSDAPFRQSLGGGSSSSASSSAMHAKS